ncbi:MAG: lysylphosphatidylglycerol synthase transmembrane domain-containing protein [Candidatus Limnocylindrales bacterium]
MRRLLPAAVGLLVSGGLIVFLLLQADPRQALATLGQTQLLLLPLALLPLWVDLLARTVRWHVLLAREPRPGYRDTYRYLTVGYLANVVLPGRLGEFVRAHLVGTRAHVGQLRALGSIALERGIDLVTAATLGALAAYAMGLHSGVAGAFTIIAIVGWVVLAVITFVPHAQVRRAIDAVVGRLNRGVGRHVAPHLGSFGHALVDATALRLVLIALALSVVSWAAATCVFAVAAAALGLSVSPVTLLAMCTAANLGAAIPSAPAGVGPFEFAVVYVGTVAGMEPSSALALGILSHLLTVIPVGAIGAFNLSSVQWDFAQLRSVARLGRDLPQETS